MDAVYSRSFEYGAHLLRIFEYNMQCSKSKHVAAAAAAWRNSFAAIYQINEFVMKLGPGGDVFFSHNSAKKYLRS